MQIYSKAAGARSPVLRRMGSVFARQGPRGVVQMVRHGVSWRYRRVVLRSEMGNGRLFRFVNRGGRVHIGGSTPVTANESTTAAESTLGSLRVPTSAQSLLPTHPTVGVVIPSYRDAAFLRSALQSVCDQRYPHWRCVVVDDASPEDVSGVVEPFRSADQRIGLLRHASNGGLSAARNTGLRHLDTDMVMFLDADDLLVPRAIENAVECFKALWPVAAVAGVHGRVVQVPEETKLSELAKWTGTSSRPVVNWASYRGECPFNVHAVVLRRALIDRIGGFDESLRDGAEDWDLWFRLLRHGYRFEPNENLMGAYRQHRASMIRRHQAVHLGRAADLFDAAESWAELDQTLVVGRGAAAPLGRARLAHERAKRAAAVIGMQIAATGTLDPLTDSEAFDLLDLAALPEDSWEPLVDAATNGTARGLGISRAIASRLSPVAADRLSRIGRAVAEAVVGRPYVPADDPRTYDATSRRAQFDIVLAAESIADVACLAPIATDAAAPNGAAAVDLELLTGSSGATEAWRRAGVHVVPYHHVVGAITEVAHLVVCSPAGAVTSDLLRAAELAGVRYHVVQVPGRPPALPCSASVVDVVSRSASDVARAVQDAGGRVAGETRRHLRGWRGSDFSAKLHLEEGPLDPPSVHRLAELHNRHPGETAVIIGNGPSLNDTEVEILTDVATFGVNAIFLGVDRFPKPITYYVVEDNAVFNENLDAIKTFDTEWKLFPSTYRSAFGESEIDDRTIFFRMNAGFYDRMTGTACHPRFSLDPTQRVYCGQSVTIINLQLAHWMGFQRVVLIGMDFSYRIPEDVERRGGSLLRSRSDDPNHFHPDYFGVGKTWKDPRLDRVLANYHLAEEVYRATGREIINATEGGKLDLFPRMPLREAIDFDS